MTALQVSFFEMKYSSRSLIQKTKTTPVSISPSFNFEIAFLCVLSKGKKKFNDIYTINYRYIHFIIKKSFENANFTLLIPRKLPKKMHLT